MIILCKLMILFYPFLFNYWFYKRMEELRVLWRDYFKFREKRVMGIPFLLTWFQKVQQFSIFFPTVLRCLSDLKVTVINQYVIEHTFIWSASVYFSTLTYTKRTFCICGRDIPPRIVHCFTFPNSRISHSGASRKI